jgi:hypothetical protein
MMGIGHVHLMKAHTGLAHAMMVNTSLMDIGKEIAAGSTMITVGTATAVNATVTAIATTMITTAIADNPIPAEHP